MKTLEQLGISPAPWKHTPADEYTHAGIDDANGDGVGETYQVARKDETAETANARLIASSPDLYEALYKITKEQECGRDCMKCKNNGCVIKECKAALAKAAGESDVAK